METTTKERNEMPATETLKKQTSSLIDQLGNAREATWLHNNLCKATTREEILQVLYAADNQVTLARAYGDLDD